VAGTWGVRVIVVPVATAADSGACFVSCQQTETRALGGYSRQISGVGQQIHCTCFMVLRYNLYEWTWSARLVGAETTMLSGRRHSDSLAITRRGLLRIGPGLTASVAAGAGVLADDQTGQPLLPQADHCIVLFLNGGPSHLDMWDMKPEAPLEIRGEFSPISSSIPGVPVSEYLPQLAQQLHRAALIRSMHHSVNNSHAAAVYAALTGHDRGEQGGGARPTDNPSPGSVVAKLRPAKNQTLPYISLPYKTREGAGGPLQPGFLAGFMGPTFDPFWVLNNPDAADFHVDNLLLLKDGQIGIIDYQDAIIGSPLYDVVSLLQDARRFVDFELADRLLEYYCNVVKGNIEEIKTIYHILGLQRNIRILGIFARKSIKTGDDSYIKKYEPILKRYIKHSLDFQSNKEFIPSFIFEF